MFFNNLDDFKDSVNEKEINEFKIIVSEVTDLVYSVKSFSNLEYIGFTDKINLDGAIELDRDDILFITYKVIGKKEIVYFLISNELLDDLDLDVTDNEIIDNILPKDKFLVTNLNRRIGFKVTDNIGYSKVILSLKGKTDRINLKEKEVTITDNINSYESILDILSFLYRYESLYIIGKLLLDYYFVSVNGKISGNKNSTDNKIRLSNFLYSDLKRLLGKIKPKYYYLKERNGKLYYEKEKVKDSKDKLEYIL